METPTKTKSQFLINLGTYDGILYGITVNKADPTVNKSLYSFAVGDRSIRAISANQKFLALGGFQEVLKLFNLKKQVECVERLENTGTITCLEFYQNSYLRSGSEDGRVLIWRVKDWSLIHTLTAKITYPVVEMAMH